MTAERGSYKSEQILAAARDQAAGIIETARGPANAIVSSATAGADQIEGKPAVQSAS